MRFSELSSKQVVEIKTGKVIGSVCDLSFLEKDFAIREFYVAPKPNCLNRLFPWLFPNPEIPIRTCDIVSIGEDVVIVQTS